MFCSGHTWSSEPDLRNQLPSPRASPQPPGVNRNTTVPLKQLRTPCWDPVTALWASLGQGVSVCTPLLAGCCRDPWDNGSGSSDVPTHRTSSSLTCRSWSRQHRQTILSNNAVSPSYWLCHLGKAPFSEPLFLSPVKRGNGANPKTAVRRERHEQMRIPHPPATCVSSLGRATPTNSLSHREAPPLCGSSSSFPLTGNCAPSLVPSPVTLSDGRGAQ